MKSIGAGTQPALTNARDTGIVPRQFFWITVKDRTTGNPVTFGLWTGDDTVSIDVISGTTGLPVTRSYGGGVNLKIGDIPRVSDLTIQTIEVEFSAIAPVCQEIVRTYDPRLAKVEIHAGFLSAVTRLPVDEPEIDFLGEVVGAPVKTGSVGGESLIKLEIVSDAISMLSRKNPRKRSYEGQKRRDGDEFGKYGNAAKTWRIFWGEREVGGDSVGAGSGSGGGPAGV